MTTLTSRLWAVSFVPDRTSMVSYFIVGGLWVQLNGNRVNYLFSSSSGCGSPSAKHGASSSEDSPSEVQTLVQSTSSSLSSMQSNLDRLRGNGCTYRSGRIVDRPGSMGLGCVIAWKSESWSTKVPVCSVFVFGVAAMGASTTGILGGRQTSQCTVEGGGASRKLP
jgi:hypothetical protein